MSAHHHPNIQGAKSSSDIKAYIDKDGDTLEWGEFQIDGRSARGGPQSINDAYAALNTGNKATAMQVIREQVPRDFVRDYPTLESNFERIFNPIQNNIFISKWDPSSFRVPDDLEQWVGEHFNKIFINADDQEGNNPAACPSENNRLQLQRLPRQGRECRPQILDTPCGVHNNEDSVKPFRPSDAYSNYISMPGLGQAVNQHHTTLIKVYSIHMTGNVHINVIKNPETVVVELLLMWAYRPTMEFAPSYGDVFKLPSMMDD
ncbi:hypothetical protein Ancab_015026 [Ancistrocladus abbreviatus]